MQTIDREILKEVVLELLVEKRELFKEIIGEVLTENQVIVSTENADKRKNVETMIDEIFEKYDDVFKALA
ncbi:MAG: hypothetical protein HY842_15925 [Bacteroidetes bacterium]|nr:hypothetical protein [Bacteroidota bacterium]